MLFKIVLLQKSSKTSKVKERSVTNERLDFNYGKMGIYLSYIQSSKSENKRDKVKIFSNLIMHGTINAAVKMLLNWNRGVHLVDDKVLKEL